MGGRRDKPKLESLARGEAAADRARGRGCARGSIGAAAEAVQRGGGPGGRFRRCRGLKVRQTAELCRARAVCLRGCKGARVGVKLQGAQARRCVCKRASAASPRTLGEGPGPRVGGGPYPPSPRPGQRTQIPPAALASAAAGSPPPACRDEEGERQGGLLNGVATLVREGAGQGGQRVWLGVAPSSNLSSGRNFPPTTSSCHSTAFRNC